MARLTALDGTTLDGVPEGVVWALEGTSARLSLRVGAATPGAGGELFLRLRDAIGASLPAQAVVESGAGVEVELSTLAIDVAMLERAVAGRAGALGALASGAGVRQARLTVRDGRRLAIDFVPPPLPDTFGALVGGTLALLWPALRDAVWSPAPTATSASEVIVEAVRGEAGAVGSAWDVAVAGAGRWLRRNELAMVRRWLGVSTDTVAALASEPPPPRTAPRHAEGALRVLPFTPRGRAVDELIEPGSGCSEFGGFLRSDASTGEFVDEGIWVLYKLDLPAGVDPADVRVELSAWFMPEGLGPVPVPRLQGVAVPPMVVGEAPLGKPPTLASVEPGEQGARSLVASISPQRQLLPGPSSYAWSEVDPALRAATPDGEDPFTFAHMNQQQVRVRLVARVGEEEVGRGEVDLVVYDAQRFGALYGRLLDLVAADTAAQQRALAEKELYAAFHPWYPVLGIGMNKADLYMRAILQDLSHQTRHLANPKWLVDVGIYLELLTCVGIFEAVRDEHPNLLTPAERRVWQESPRFAELRARINPERWRGVWGLREIVGRGLSPLALGPVGVMNLMRKQAATLGFLRAHHEDLVHAVELSGPNLIDSQQTWHRVYRDAERAVVTSSMGAFPELRYVVSTFRDFMFWHEKGEFNQLVGIVGTIIPGVVASALGDQDGVYPSGARQYRASMNHVAALARSRGLMDFAGEECVPREASLIEALLDKDEARFANLQARDGYGGGLHAIRDTVRLVGALSPASIRAALRAAPIFAVLEDDEIARLVEACRVVNVVPDQAVIQQGEHSVSLFVVEAGRLEVVVRATAGGEAKAVGQLQAGDVFGERGFLTGEPRSATVRALDFGVLVELSREALKPLIVDRPALAGALGELLAWRRAALTRTVAATSSRGAFASRIRAYFLGADAVSTEALDEPTRRGRLRSVALFRPFTDPEIAHLAALSSATAFGAGQWIVRQNDRSHAMFVIHRGKVEVVHDGRRLATLGEGEIFGEMAMLTGEPRAAGVRACGEAVLIELARSDLMPVISRRPTTIVEMGELLSERRTALATSAEAGQSGRLATRIRRFVLG